jgi:hypothetical protein
MFGNPFRQAENSDTTNSSLFRANNFKPFGGLLVILVRSCSKKQTTSKPFEFARTPYFSPISRSLDYWPIDRAYWPK